MFDNSRDFYIKNLFAVDGKHTDEFAAINKSKDLEKAVCMGAGHQSAERYDPPKCHPETRAAVIRDIMSWVKGEDDKKPIMWMSGPAGAGKSAIAQTICEKCDKEKILLGSFFFSRTAAGTGRNDGNRLVPTIAAQVGMVIPKARKIIIEKLVETNSATLTFSMEQQLQKLILDPLAQVDDEEYDSKDLRTHYLVVIDGLDECNNAEMQCRIVKMIYSIFAEGKKVPLQFLIVSRPEQEIRNSFASVIDSGMCAQIVLNEKYRPDDDIRAYLRSEFETMKREHTLRGSLSQEPDWPSSEDMEELVKKSSGQFIYASTVTKYLKNPRRDPRDGLFAILTTDNNSRPVNESLYGPLDLLYKHILFTASAAMEDSDISYTTVLQIMLYAHETFGRTVDDMSYFLGIKPSKLELLLVDLHSILHVPGPHSTNNKINIYHASFGDFLKNSSRSENFYISSKVSHKIIAKYCCSKLLDCQRVLQWNEPELDNVQEYSAYFYFKHLAHSEFDDELLAVLRSGKNLSKLLDVFAKIKDYDPLESVMNFSFKSTDITYWSPSTEKIRDICSEIVSIVEEVFFAKRHSLGAYEDKDLMEAIRYNTYEQFSSDIQVRKVLEKGHHVYPRWLGYFLENPLRGKHLYLDGEISLLLYTSLTMTNGNQYCDRKDPYHPYTLKYLKTKIRPSADVYIPSFPYPQEHVMNGMIYNHKRINNYPVTTPTKNISKKFKDILRNLTCSS